MIDLLRIEWPSGAVQAFTEVVRDRILSIVEGMEGAGYPCADMIGNVDACGYLGWISIRYAPWIYCFGVDCWRSLPEDHLRDTGAWAFIAR